MIQKQCINTNNIHKHPIPVEWSCRSKSLGLCKGLLLFADKSYQPLLDCVIWRVKMCEDAPPLFKEGLSHGLANKEHHDFRRLPPFAKKSIACEHGEGASAPQRCYSHDRSGGGGE